MNPILHISVGSSRLSKSWKPEELTWEEFIERISKTKRTSETQEEYLSYDKATQDNIKDVGGFVGGTLSGSQRKNENVVDRCLLTFDIDGTLGDQIIRPNKRLAWALYTTHKHKPGAPRYRLIFPLSRPVTPEEYTTISHSLAESTAASYGLKEEEVFRDKSTHEPARLMYWPSTSRDGEFIAEHNEGELLNVEEVLKRAKPAPAKEPAAEYKTADYKFNNDNLANMLDGSGRYDDMKSYISRLSKLGIEAEEIKLLARARGASYGEPYTEDDFRAKNLWKLLSSRVKTDAQERELRQARASALEDFEGEFEDQIASQEQKETPELDNVAAYALQQFTEDVQTFKKGQSIKTGYYELDRTTDGLYSGLYILGAVTGLGKTTFIHQMADQMAESGQHVIYFSLEQSRAELLSKSLAREILRQEAGDDPDLNPDSPAGLSSLQIRKGQAKNLEKLLEGYTQRIGDRLTIHEGNMSTDVKELREYVANYIEAKGVRPVVIVDYMQIITNKTEKDPRMKIDGVVRGLKIMSRDYNIPVIAISNLNRENYLYTISTESFKESGLIEYTADVIWGLQYKVLTSTGYNLLKPGEVTKKREAVEAAKSATPREVLLRCIKNRFGGDYTIGLDYYPHRDLFLDGWSCSAERMREQAQEDPWSKVPIK